MTAHELKQWLHHRFPLENEQCEFKEWRSLKSSISGRKGEDLVSYVSALANMDGGCVVIGVQDKTLRVTGIQDFADYTPENVVHRILGKTPGLPSVGFRVEVLETSDTNATVWLIHVPRHAPRQPVLAHDKAWQRDGDSLTELREERRKAILTELIVGEDWSAEIVMGASASDLDPPHQGTREVRGQTPARALGARDRSLEPGTVSGQGQDDPAWEDNAHRSFAARAYGKRRTAFAESC